MNKTTLLAIAVLLLIVVAACSLTKDKPRKPSLPQSSVPELSSSEPESSQTDPASPENAVVSLFDSVRSWDKKRMENYLPNGISLEQYVPAALEAPLRQLLERMDYTILGSDIAGDTATVEVEITSVDTKGALNDSVGAVIAYAAKQKLTGGELNQSELLQVVADSMNIAGLPPKTTTATAYLIRGADNEWKMDLSNQENLSLVNAATGGSLEFAQQIRDLAGTYGLLPDSE